MNENSKLNHHRNTLEKIWKSTLVTAILYFIVCLTWGTTWIGIKIAVESVPPLLAAGLRFIIAFPFLIIIAYLAKAPLTFPKDKIFFFVILTLFYFTVPYYLISYGEKYVSSGLTSLIFSTMPIFSTIFSFFILKEKIFINQIIGIILGFICLVMILHTQGITISHTGFSGVIAILLAALMHGFLYVYSKKNASNINVFTFNTLPIGIAGFLLCSFSFIFESPSIENINLNSWLALLYLGVVASVGGFIIYFYLLKRMSPVSLSFIFIIFPVIAILIDTMYEHKSISSNFLFYSAFMLIGFSITKMPLQNFFERFKFKNLE